VNEVERAFADLTAAAAEAAGKGPRRATAAIGGGREEIVALFAARAQALVNAARTAAGGWVGVRLDDPGPDDLRKLSSQAGDFTLDDWAYSYDAALDGQLMTQLGRRLPPDGSHRAGRAYRCWIT
jgi:hypothetical protein